VSAAGSVDLALLPGRSLEPSFGAFQDVQKGAANFREFTSETVLFGSFLAVIYYQSMLRVFSVALFGQSQKGYKPTDEYVREDVEKAKETS
jgi:hypothetical protein